LDLWEVDPLYKGKIKILGKYSESKRKFKLKNDFENEFMLTLSWCRFLAFDDDLSILKKKI